MTKGVASPRITVERRSHATSRAPTQEIRVMRSMTWAWLCAKKAPTSRANTGSLAPQFMKGTVSRVASRSLGDLRVLAAMTPGTAQPPAIPPDTMNAMTELP